MAFTEDLTPFLSTDEFAVDATVDGVQVSVIFDNGYALGTVGLIGMASAEPTITLPTANVPASPVGKAVVVDGVAYTIAAPPQADGTGVSVCELKKAA